MSSCLRAPTCAPWAAGKTLAENLEDCPPLKQGQDLLRPLSNPLKASAHIQILYGNLAPDGAVGETLVESCAETLPRAVRPSRLMHCTLWSLCSSCVPESGGFWHRTAVQRACMSIGGPMQKPLLSQNCWDCMNRYVMLALQARSQGRRG